MGVHGAALTYFVFMQPGTALIQVKHVAARDVIAPTHSANETFVLGIALADFTRSQ